MYTSTGVLKNKSVLNCNQLFVFLKGLSHIKVYLASPNIRDTVATVLTSCQLPLDYINTISEVPTSSKTKVHHGPDFRDIFAGRKGGEAFYRKVEKLNLL